MDQSNPTSATAKRDLHTLRPLWAATPHISVESAPAPSSRHYDVIVIGTGISGALAAQALSDGKRKVLVLDRRTPARGSSLASTAMIQHEIDVPLHQLAGMIGDEKAARAWRRSALAVRDLQTLADELGIACGMEARKALYLAGDEVGMRALQSETDARHAAGIGADYLRSSEVAERFGIDRTGAIVSDISASANPAQLTAGLLREAVAKGAEIVSPLEITNITAVGDAVALATADGHLLTAGDVVCCSGYEFLRELQSDAHRIISTWAIATEPRHDRPEWLDEYLVWEGSDPYLYFRSTPDGRIVAGGEDEDDPTGHEDIAKSERKFARIVEKLGDLIGVKIGTPAYRWAAPFGTTSTGLPIIDTVPGMKHVHVVMGFGGNGITFSMIAAQIVAARINGKPDPDEDLFRYPGG